MSDLIKLPNIGATLVAELSEIGVTTSAQLAALGSIEAARQIARRRSGTCHSLLFALEGAIRGIRWHALPKAERAALARRFDEVRNR